MNEKQKYQRFCRDLQKQYIEYLSGEGESNNIIYDSLPSEKLAIGVLDSDVDINDSRTFARTMPIAKVQFYSNLDEDGELSFKIDGNLYYNVLPTYEEEVEFIEKQKRIADLQKNSDEQNKDVELSNKEETIFSKPPRFRQKFKRVKLSEILPIIKIDKKTILKNSEIDLSSRINEALSNSDNYPDAIFYATDRSIPLKTIESKEQYEDYIKKHSFGDNSQIIKAILRWQFKVTLSREDISDHKCLITFSVENITEKPNDYDRKKKEFMDTKYSIPVYNIGIKVAGDQNFKFDKISLNNFVKSYKIDSDIYAKGEWLTAKFDESKNEIVTENAPVFEEYRILTRDEYDKTITFDNLQNNPEEHLKTILSGMNDYYEIIASRSEYHDNPEFQSDIQKFAQEKHRFEMGLNILVDDSFPEIKKAFILMNKAFKKNGYPGWRLFQLVFIVSMIPDIAYYGNEDFIKNMFGYVGENTADILYFPTGGGKTEAFLGTVALSMFYDRLTGKEYGVNSIIKYPLRLLSVQQLERTLNMIINSNEILESELPGHQGFTLGYYVGGSNTPNHIDIDNVEKYEHNPEFTLVKKCPYHNCNGDVDIVFNKERCALEHRCTSCGKVLPLYIVDTEIYRYVPTVVISTVDKFAAIANQDGFRNLIGGAKRYCKKHGFCTGKKCSVNTIDDTIDISEIQKESMVPSFLIQDEVHLLKESLGVFSAHYESLVDEYTTRMVPEKNQKHIKHIGATATISGADSLVKELYNKECVIFPSPSTYSNGDNFYSYRSKDDLGRIIIGFAPYGDSIVARVEYSVSTLRIILDDYFNNAEKYCKRYEMEEEDFKKMVFHYWTTIIYFLSKRDSNNLVNTFEQQANLKSLVEHSGASFNIAKMTGDESFSDIKATLQEIESEKDKKVAKNLILATSTISHGVDSKEFNDMFFFGIPSNTAEYIQSYSRVGRFYTGIVVDVIRLMRNRDISFLKYFDLYHKYKDYLIDETDINTKAIVAIERTLPGIFMAVLRHHFAVKDNRKYETMKSLDEFLSNAQNRKEMFDILCRIYRCPEQQSDSYNEIIQKLLAERILRIAKNTRNMLDESITNNAKIAPEMKILTEDGFKIMTSLRNVDIDYDISLAKGGN